MQFNAVGSNARLAVKKIKHAHTHNLHWDVGCLEAGSGGEPGVKLGSRILDSGKEGATRANTGRRRDFRDHGVPGCILNHQMIVGIIFQLVLSQCRIDHPYRRFRWRNPIVRWNRAGRRNGPHGSDGGVAGRIQVDFACVRVSARFH